MKGTKKRRLIAFMMTICIAFSLLSFYEPVIVKAAETTGDGFMYEHFQDSYTGQAGVQIIGYVGGQNVVVVPEQINGLPVLKLQGTFYNNTSITQITLPRTLLEIGENTFSGCTSLHTIEVTEEEVTTQQPVTTQMTTTQATTTQAATTQVIAEGTTDTTSEEATSEDKTKELSTEQVTTQATTSAPATTTQKQQNTNKKGTVFLPDGVRSIGNGAFDNCKSIEEVHINRDLTFVGVRSFFKCTSLRKFVVDENNNCYIADAYGVLYQKIVGEDVSAYTGVPSDPSAVTYHLVRWPIAAPMNTYDFSASGGLYPMHDAMTKIESYAFENVNFNGIGLKIGAPCYVIGDYAFYQCNNLSGEVTFDANCKTVLLGNYAFSGNETIHQLTLPVTVKTVGAYCFANCTNLDTVIFSQGLTSIMEGAFYNCRTLHTITIPEGITTIENATFSECTNLGIVILPQSLTTIGDEAFKNCVTIHEMVIPPNVKYVANSSFTGANLAKIDFSQNVLISKQLGIDVVEPQLNTPSFVLKKGGKATISITLNGDIVTGYTLNKAAKKKISVTQDGVIKVKKKAKKGKVYVTINMQSGLVYTIPVYITNAKITPVKKKKAIKVKKGKKIQLTYTKNPLAVKYTIPKASKKYLSVNAYGTLKAKKYTKKTVYVNVKTENKTIKQKIKITK